MSETSPEPRGDRYHHGDLRRALTEAAYELAREGGADAVVLREATRRVGVTARAAYRHFNNREDLMLAAAHPAMADLAREVEARLAALATGPDGPDAALAHLEAVGLGYIQFALDAPGAFDIAFFGMATMEQAHHPDAAGPAGRTPFEQLEDAIVHCVQAGLLPPERAEVAATLCWSAVHGFAALATTGPIRTLPRPALDAMAAELVRGAARAITADLSVRS